MKKYTCPLCKAERGIRSLGPYTITLTCGATLFAGTPAPGSTLHRTWWSFEDHQD